MCPFGSLFLNANGVIYDILPVLANATLIHLLEVTGLDVCWASRRTTNGKKRYMPEEIVAKPAVGRMSWSRRAKHVQPIDQIGAGPFVGEEFPEVQKGRRRANRKPSPQGRAGDGLH